MCEGRNEREKGERDEEEEAVGEAQGRPGEPREGQGEVRWNAVTVDRGLVLVQVLQGPRDEAHEKERREQREVPRRTPKIVAAVAIHYRGPILPCVYTLIYVSWPNKFPPFYNRQPALPGPIYGYRDYSQARTWFLLPQKTESSIVPRSSDSGIILGKTRQIIFEKIKYWYKHFEISYSSRLWLILKSHQVYRLFWSYWYFNNRILIKLKELIKKMFKIYSLNFCCTWSFFIDIKEYV